MSAPAVVLQAVDMRIEDLDEALRVSNSLMFNFRKLQSACKGTGYSEEMRAGILPLKNQIIRMSEELSRARIARKGEIDPQDLPKRLPHVSPNAVINYSKLLGINLSDPISDAADRFGKDEDEVTHGMVIDQLERGHYRIGFNVGSARSHILCSKVLKAFFNKSCKDGAYEMPCGNWAFFKNCAVVTVRDNGEWTE